MAIESFGEVLIKHPDYAVSAQLRASYNADPKSHGGSYLHTATVVVETGACDIHVYATADQLRNAAAMLLRAADAVDAGVRAASSLEAA